MTTQEAIHVIEECREVHVKWADYQEVNPEWEEETPSSQVGDAEHHREWVRKYDGVLEALKRESDTAQAVAL